MDNWHPWETDALLQQKLMHLWEERVDGVVAWSFLFFKHFPHTGDSCAFVSISIHKASHIWTQPSFKSPSCVRLFETPWTVGCQAPLSMGILQARILEWVVMPSSRGSSQPRSPALQAASLPSEPPGKPHLSRIYGKRNISWMPKQC